LIGVSPSVASQHLAKLRLARVVTTRRSGTRVFHAAADVHVRQLAEEALFHADHVTSDLPDHGPTRSRPRAVDPTPTRRRNDA
jgi:DNA-binding transcriptional ArsR family regulator